MLFNIKIASALLVNNSYCACKDFSVSIAITYLNFLISLSFSVKIAITIFEFNICHDIFQY